jgi:hypothetical protein
MEANMSYSYFTREGANVMSQYVELMQLRKDALFGGDRKKAEEYRIAAQKLRDKGEVSSKDHLASAYT